MRKFWSFGECNIEDIAVRYLQSDKVYLLAAVYLFTFVTVISFIITYVIVVCDEFIPDMRYMIRLWCIIRRRQTHLVPPTF